MEIWQIYLLTVLDGVNVIFGLISVFFGVAVLLVLGGSVCGALMEDGEDRKRLNALLDRHRGWAISIFLVSIIMQAITPSTKQAFMIVGGYYATNIEGIADLPPNAMKAANAFLEKYAEEKGGGK